MGAPRVVLQGPTTAGVLRGPRRWSLLPVNLCSTSASLVVLLLTVSLTSSEQSIRYSTHMERGIFFSISVADPYNFETDPDPG